MAEKPILPRDRRERAVTLAAAMLVLVGGLVAVAAWRKAPQRPELPPSPTVAATPEVIPGSLTGLTILVDPGHGGYDGGAKCRDSGIWEKQVNLDVAFAVKNSLTRRGVRVVMTRQTDEDLCSEDRPKNLTKKRQDMQNRVALAEEEQADLVLSIHMNEYRDRRESGPQVFYRAGCDGGRLLAGCMQEALIAHLSPKKERVAMAGDYFILRLDVPSVLIECGFISNAEEEALLLTPEYQERLGEAIAEGVEAFLSLQTPR